MDRIVVRGGKALKGRIPISGAKNAALPLMTAALLTEDPVTLTNLPRLADIESLAALIGQHGADIRFEPKGDAITITAAELPNTTAPYDLVRKMRASILVLGPLVARMGYARVSLPGGCAIGARPVDMHLKGLADLGATIHLEDGYVIAEAPGGLKGGEIVLPKPSVGATENLMMAAALARGDSTIRNAAREPEISDLARCLNSMGAEIHGAGSDTLRIKGVDRLNGTRHPVVPDRIEAGTYAIAGAITGGELELAGIDANLIESPLEALRRAGVGISETPEGLRIAAVRGGLTGCDVMTEPFPGFPTDLQAQFMALMAVADGAAMVTETIFENRFMHVPELCRMGANITIHTASAMVRGVKRLTGAPVMATDLRASVSLILAGLAAEGETVLNRVYHLDRGYDRLEEKLAACGADIVRHAVPREQRAAE